jgi:hypothetical protein
MDNILPEGGDDTLLKILFQTVEDFDINDYWRECLRMWRWIVAQNPQTTRFLNNVIQLKREWLKKENYKKGTILGNCFFCHSAGYLTTDPENLAADCSKCPAVAIDPEFDCALREYNYLYKPKSFLAKLERLDKKRRKLQRNRN